ncbi:hypothetical protein BH09BAC2_BH09BAC2_09200 [soil metagenome]
MNNHYNNPVSDLNNADWVSLREQFPYSNYLHFALLNSLKNNREALAEYKRTAAIHFSDPFLLNWQLLYNSSAYGIAAVEKVSKKVIEQQPDREQNDMSSEVPDINLSQSAAEPLVQKNKPEDDELIFEPLYKTDYFASQGIKLTDEPVSNDKLGKQLKSFTEWLKSMKKIHPDAVNTPSVSDDKRIQTIAESSNTIEDVLTESMAEVYIMQDKPDKAIEVYEKLSLTNPSKSAYFAAKIESIIN